MQKEILKMAQENLNRLKPTDVEECPYSDWKIIEMTSIAETIIHLLKAYQDNLSVPHISESAPSIYNRKGEKHCKKLKND